MTSLLIVSFSPIARDPRVLRQIRELRDDYALTVAGFGDFAFDGVECVCLTATKRTSVAKVTTAAALLARRFSWSYWHQRAEVAQLLDLLAGRRFDGALANDIDSLPAALRLAGGAPVVVDLHEFALDEGGSGWQDRWLWSRFKRWLCDAFLLQAAGAMTVADGIAAEYSSSVGIPAPVVVANAPARQHLVPSLPSDGCVRLIHHGSAAPGRGVEELISLMPRLDGRFELHLMLVATQPDRLDALRASAAATGRIYFHEPVATESICERINEFDVGVHLLPPDSFNSLHALPNKFFEFVQARLAIAIGPSPEMARYVNEYGLGVVSPTFEPGDLAIVLNALTAEDIQRFKQASDRAANELCWENYAPRLREMVRTALEG